MKSKLFLALSFVYLLYACNREHCPEKSRTLNVNILNIKNKLLLLKGVKLSVKKENVVNTYCDPIDENLESDDNGRISAAFKYSGHYCETGDNCEPKYEVVIPDNYILYNYDIGLDKSSTIALSKKNYLKLTILTDSAKVKKVVLSSYFYKKSYNTEIVKDFSVSLPANNAVVIPNTRDTTFGLRIVPFDALNVEMTSVKTYLNGKDLRYQVISPSDKDTVVYTLTIK